MNERFRQNIVEKMAMLSSKQKLDIKANFSPSPTESRASKIFLENTFSTWQYCIKRGM
jgi:hypothetical protein